MPEDSTAAPAAEKPAAAAPAAEKPAAKPAAAAPAAAPPAPAEVAAPTGGTSAATIQQPQLTSEQIQQVAFCRKFLKEVQGKEVASGKNFVNALDIQTTLGTGTFGRVRLCSLKEGARSSVTAAATGEEKGMGATIVPKFFALKIMKKLEVVRLKQVEHIRNEKEILMGINHPFLVTLYAVAQDRFHLYMLLDYIVGGELFTHLRKAGKFSSEHGRFYAAQITMGLQYLHEECEQGCIVYRDLKPENILIDREGYIKVTDFGFAKKIEDRTWTLCGTPEYLAPEIIQSKGHGKAVDWWALGVLIYEMLAGYPPFYDENPFGIYQLILAGKVEFPRFVETHARDLVRKLLTADRAKRLGNLRAGGDDVRRHKWYRGLDFNAVFKKEAEAPFVPETTGDGDTSQFEEYPESNDIDYDKQPDPLPKETDADLFGSF